MRLLTPTDTYNDVYDQFEWDIPERINMAQQTCERHARINPDQVGLIVANTDDSHQEYTWSELSKLSNQMANLITDQGLARGDRFGILLSQSVEAALGHLACWKMGAISIPLFSLFGEEALLFRLKDSGAKMIMTESRQLDKILAIRDQLPDLEHIILIDANQTANTTALWPNLKSASDQFEMLDTGPDDPAYIIYTSGTTGNPKGALMGHRSLLGHMAGVEFFHDFFPQPDDLMWTPADWAWIGGLMNCLMGAWYHGVPVLAYRAPKYDPEDALRLMAKYNVRNTFMPPTALKIMKSVPDIKSFGTNLRTIAVAGEPMGRELLDWGQREFGITFNEFYGQTECNLVVGNCQQVMDVVSGSMGKPIPGHTVAVIDDVGNQMRAGEEGQIAVRRADPVMMLEYWNNPEATQKKFLDDWLLTGDQGMMDENGYLWFLARDDDVITSAGYRIGPGEIEDCLTKHEAVSLAAAIGVPDPVRTEIVKVFITLNHGYNASTALQEDIKSFVKKRLSPHEYPREIEFVENLPVTSTGKIKRNDLRALERAKRHA